jgi:small nuclear ribonucleoprotein (snRNP)-like protein
VIIIAASAPVALAREQGAASQDWDSLKSLSLEDEVIVKLKDGRTRRGKVANITDRSLDVAHKNGAETLNRDEVVQVYQVKRKAAKARFALIGAAVGVAVGAGIGAAKNSPNKDDGEIYTIIGTTVGASIGALVGTVTGIARRKRALIYQAK